MESGQDGNRTRIFRLGDDNPQLCVPKGQEMNQGGYCFTVKLPAQIWDVRGAGLEPAFHDPNDNPHSSSRES